jgi:hypothetical protein
LVHSSKKWSLLNKGSRHTLKETSEHFPSRSSLSEYYRYQKKK